MSMSWNPASKSSIEQIVSEIATGEEDAMITLTDGQTLFGKIDTPEVDNNLKLRHDTSEGEYLLEIPISDISGVLESDIILDNVEEPWMNNTFLLTDLHDRSRYIAENEGYPVGFNPNPILEEFKLDELTDNFSSPTFLPEIYLDDIDDVNNIEFDNPSPEEIIVGAPYISPNFFQFLKSRFGWKEDETTKIERILDEPSEITSKNQIIEETVSHQSEIEISSDLSPHGFILGFGIPQHIYYDKGFFSSRDLRTKLEKLNLGFDVSILGTLGMSASPSGPDYWKIYRRMVSRTAISPNELSTNELGTLEAYLTRLKSGNSIITAEMEDQTWHLYILSTEPISTLQDCTPETSVMCWFKGSSWYIDERWVRMSPRTYNVFGEVMNVKPPWENVNQDCILKARGASYLPD